MKKYYTTSNATVMFNIVAGYRPVLLKTVKECSDTNLRKAYLQLQSLAKSAKKNSVKKDNDAKIRASFRRQFEQYSTRIKIVAKELQKRKKK